MHYLFEDFALDTERRELRQGGAVAVEPQVFDLLTYLLQHRDRVVSQEDLLTHVWQGRNISDSSFRARINAARTAIGDNGEAQRLIRTLPRKGFRFVGAVTEAATAQPPASAPIADGPASVTDPLPAAAVAPDPAATPSGHLAPSPPASAAPRRRKQMAALVAVLGVIAAAAVLYAAWPVPNQIAVGPASQQPFDASIIPLIADRGRQVLASYPSRPDFKALAIGRWQLGLADTAPNIETAKQDALRRCNAGADSPCRLYAVGNDVVWPKDSIPLPDTEDLRTEPLDVPLVPDDVPLMNLTSRQNLSSGYLTSADHRALAMTLGTSRFITSRQSRSEAARMVVEYCSDFRQRPCLVLAVDGFLTVQVPKSRKVVDIFLPSTQKDIAEPDRQRIAQAYRGREWRAVARGKQGGWHPVANASSESAAIDAALGACRQADEGCRLYAIGNFRVAEE